MPKLKTMCPRSFVPLLIVATPCSTIFKLFITDPRSHTLPHLSSMNCCNHLVFGSPVTSETVQLYSYCCAMIGSQTMLCMHNLLADLLLMLPLMSWATDFIERAISRQMPFYVVVALRQ
eukprot:TRINITY_DN9646_c0_g1_i1.p1 TRINITY_DN9646_c0_g1~~TRINITY_DN9646_c0_g1_i1.p1  ORF type:complete len:119 (+),score=11.46 TRINITY_DN9646_c0_g1_i1:641-997(+)